MPSALAALRSLDAITLVSPLVDKYLQILGTTKGRKPSIEIANNIGSRWLGRCVFYPDRLGSTTIQIQKSILSHPMTLERVVAHEVVHHHNYMDMNEVDFALLRRGIGDGHGREFEAQAARINAVMGPNFITKKSDSEYVLDKETKPYYLLIESMPTGVRLGYTWGVRLTPKMKDWVRKRQARGAKLLMSTSSKWIEGCPSRFGSGYVGVCIPREAEHQQMLRALFESGQNIVV